MKKVYTVKEKQAYYENKMEKYRSLTNYFGKLLTKARDSNDPKEAYYEKMYDKNFRKYSLATSKEYYFNNLLHGGNEFKKFYGKENKKRTMSNYHSYYDKKYKK